MLPREKVRSSFTEVMLPWHDDVVCNEPVKVVDEASGVSLSTTSSTDITPSGSEPSLTGLVIL
jgi:hypothetical protein